MTFFDGFLAERKFWEINSEVSLHVDSREDSFEGDLFKELENVSES